jgi:hypothetical protein
MYIVVFTDFEKNTGFHKQKALWNKMRKKGISTKVVECIKRMCDETQFCTKWSYGEVTEPVNHEIGVRQCCNLSPHLFNIFIHNITSLITEENANARVLRNQRIFALLFADDLVTGSFTINGLQKGTYHMMKCCNKWNLKCNNRIKVSKVFKGGGKFKNRKYWYMYGQSRGGNRVYLF